MTNYTKMSTAILQKGMALRNLNSEAKLIKTLRDEDCESWNYLKQELHSKDHKTVAASKVRALLAVTYKYWSRL